MSFESFLEKITTPSGPEDVLVVKAEFNELQGIVVNKKGEKLVIGYEAKSKLFDLNLALTEVIEKVRKAGWKGQYAIMVNPAVCMTVLDLNIPVKNKLQTQQIAETMQWEVEPVYNQHKSLLVIGHLLQLADHLNVEQIEVVVKQQNELINSKNSAVDYKRFGEIALQAGFINKQQLDDALTRQQWFVNESDVLKCGWHGLEGAQTEEASDYKWAVAAVNQDILRTWQAAFSKHEIKLEAMFPIAGGGKLPVIDGTVGKKEPVIKDSEEVLLELHNGVMAASLLSADVPMQIQSMPCADEVVLANVTELITSLGVKEEALISLVDCMSRNDQQSEQLVADVKAILGRPIEKVTIPAGKIGLPVRNAVRKFFNVTEASYVEGVSTYEALPPVMQRFPVRAVLTGLSVVGLIVLSEVGVFASALWSKTQTAAISEDVNRIRDEVKRINKKINTVQKLNAEIKEKQTKKNNAVTMISLLTKELPERNQGLSQLMDRLQESITEDVVVNSIREDTLLGFDFNAWALSDQAAQSFIKSFQLAIHPLNYRVKNLTVQEGTGRLGLIGYSVNFSITQLSDTELTKRKKQPRAYY